MKKIWIGLVILLILNGVAYFMVMPKMTLKSYSEGYEKGLLEGTAAGNAQAKKEQKHLADSLNTAVKKKVVVPVKVSKPRPKVQPVNKNDINYNVYGNQVGEERKPVAE